MKRWQTAATVTLPPPVLKRFHSVEGYRWDRLALYLESGRQVPEFVPDDEIDDAINTLWEQRHWLLR